MPTRTIRLTLAAVAGGGRGDATLAQPPGIADWRRAHERQIVDELTPLVAIPNVAGNDTDMRRNADHLAGLFEKRGFTVETVERHRIAGRVRAASTSRRRAARSTSTSTTTASRWTPAEWTRCKPFAPCVCGRRRRGRSMLRPTRSSIRSGASTAARRPTTRAPIVAVLNAVEALQAPPAAGRPGTCASCSTAKRRPARPTSAASRRRAPQALKADLAITLDGPRHPSGRPTVYFGVRGGAGVTLTVYGARRRSALGQLRQLGARSRRCGWPAAGEHEGRRPAG